MKPPIRLLAAALAAALATAGGYYAGRLHPDAPAPAKSADAGRRILYWHDPMVPGQRFDKPGKSPYMDMDLVPVYADEAPAAAGVAISPRAIQNMGVRLGNVESASLSTRIAAVGTVQADESRVAVVQSRVGGYVEAQPVRTLGAPVAAGQTLVEIASPELIAAQQEFLLALRNRDTPLATAGRERLALLGLAPDQLARIERSGAPIARVALRAPIGGVVTEVAARPGMTVMPGAPLYTIGNLDQVWVIADVPEAQAAALQPGLAAELRFPALPGVTTRGRVDYVYPEVAAATRTLRIRIRVANPDGALRPNLQAQVLLAGAPRAAALQVPSEALIETGRRTVVIVAEGGGRFRPATVKTGSEADGRTEILDGLAAGQQVVLSGQFLIDSEASLKSALDRLAGPPAPAAAAPAAPAAGAHPGHGRIVSLDAAAGRVKLAHGPLTTLGMPGMTMSFPVEPPSLLKGLHAGQEVDFELVDHGDLQLSVVRIAPKP